MRTKVSDVCQRIFSEVDTDCKFLSVFWSRSALPLIQQGTIKHSRSTIKHFVVDTQQFCQAIYDDALKAIIFFCTIIFLYKLFFWTNIFSAQMFFCTNIFLYEYFSVRIFFCVNVFLCDLWRRSQCHYELSCHWSPPLCLQQIVCFTTTVAMPNSEEITQGFYSNDLLLLHTTVVQKSLNGIFPVPICPYAKECY